MEHFGEWNSNYNDLLGLEHFFGTDLAADMGISLRKRSDELRTLRRPPAVSTLHTSKFKSSDMIHQYIGPRLVLKCCKLNMQSELSELNAEIGTHREMGQKI